MNRKFTYLLFFAAVAILFSACSDYNKLLKSSDYKLKYDAAVKYYDQKEFGKAIPLLEELLSVYRGTDKAEKIMYYYAFSVFSNSEYLLAGYHFNNFVKTFPGSDKSEECAFMYAYCFYLESPRYTLDQTDTKNSIKELQLFINRYPNSSRIAECNNLITTLRSKLEQKYFEIAKQYYFLEDYKASIVTFESTLKEFPDTKYREEILYLILKANFKFANRSIEKKKEDRLKSTIAACNKYISYFPENGKFNREVDSYSQIAKEQLEKIKN